MLIIEEKLIQVDMLRLEVGRKGLRADVPHEREREREREREMRTLLKGLILWRVDGVIGEKSCNTKRKRIYHMMNNENIDNK